MAQVDAQIDLVEWCKSERSRLQQALDLLRASKFRAGKKTVGSRWVDTTAAGIERIISCIDELDKLLAESERRSRAGVSTMSGVPFGLSGGAADETIKQASLLQHPTGDEGYHRNSSHKKQTDRKRE